MKVSITKSRFNDVGKAFSIPDGSDIELDVSESYFERVGEVLHVRSVEFPQSLKELSAVAEKYGVPPEGVQQVIEAAQTHTAEEARIEAVRNSSTWSVVKDIGPEVVAFVVRCAVEYLKK